MPRDAFAGDPGATILAQQGHAFRIYSELVSTGSNAVFWLIALTNPTGSGIYLRVDRVELSSNNNFQGYSYRGTGTIASGGVSITIGNPFGLSASTSGVSAPVALTGSTSITVSGGTQHQHGYGAAFGVIDFFAGGITAVQPGQTLCWGIAPVGTVVSGAGATAVVHYSEIPLGAGV